MQVLNRRIISYLVRVQSAILGIQIVETETRISNTLNSLHSHTVCPESSIYG